MNKIKNSSLVILILITFVFGYLLFKKKEPDIVKVPVVIEVPVPGKAGSFLAVEMPKPKKVKPRPKLVEEFKEATDSIQVALYEDAVKERTYDTIYSDDNLTVAIKEIVQGRLLKRDLSYNIKPSTVTLDTVLEVPVKNKLKVFLGGGLGIPLEQNSTNDPVIQGNLLIKTKNDRIVNFGYDTNGYFHFGYNIKI